MVCDDGDGGGGVYARNKYINKRKRGPAGRFGQGGGGGGGGWHRGYGYIV